MTFFLLKSNCPEIFDLGESLDTPDFGSDNIISSSELIQKLHRAHKSKDKNEDTVLWAIYVARLVELWADGVKLHLFSNYSLKSILESKDQPKITGSADLKGIDLRKWFEGLPEEEKREHMIARLRGDYG